MLNDTAQEKLLRELTRFFRRFRPGGNLGPIENRDKWERLVKSKSPKEQELLNELARFSDLWRYLQERNEKLGPAIVIAISEVHKLPLSQRAARIREINQELMRHIGEFGPGTPQ